jgi:CRP/FNR family cyclic AMP-dependent transcriptional regulator
MASILDLIQEGQERRFDTGEIVLEEGSRSGRLFFLIEGAVEVVKDGVQLAKASTPGTVFGDVAALLDRPHFATVRALQPCAFRIIANPHDFLAASPLVGLHLCEVMAGRLDGLIKYLVDTKRQYGGEDHLGMIGAVLETLMHRQAASHKRPSESTIREGELPD